MEVLTDGNSDNYTERADKGASLDSNNDTNHAWWDFVLHRTVKGARAESAVLGSAFSMPKRRECYCAYTALPELPIIPKLTD